METFEVHQGVKRTTNILSQNSGLPGGNSNQTCPDQGLRVRCVTTSPSLLSGYHCFDSWCIYFDVTHKVTSLLVV
jgi:hypothetical protein